MKDYAKEIIEMIANLKKEDQAFFAIKTNENMKMIAIGLSESETVSLIEFCKAKILYNNFKSNEGLSSVPKKIM